MPLRLVSIRAAAAAAFLASTVAAGATPSLVIDIDSGEILHQEQATANWYPASLTKLMTAYVALQAVREGRLTLDTPLRVSARAARMAPSKMGFRPGTEVTLDNALKMLMVKSANDIAVTIAEGVGGSVEGFAGEMNRYSASLGMRESHWANPNGLPNDSQVTSARDMAVLGRALYREFPEQRGLWGIGALQLGPRLMPTHNGLMGRYPGVEGMKTGFTCAAGFNVVASAARGGRRLITVIMGAPSATDRTAKAAQLFDKAFAGAGGQGQVAGLYSPGVNSAPNMRGSACVRRGRSGGWLGEDEDFTIPLTGFQAQIENNPALEMLLERSGQVTRSSSPAGGRAVARLPRPYFEPVKVYIGRAPGWNGPTLAAREAAPKPALARAPLNEVSPAATAFAPARPTVIDGAEAPVGAAMAAPLRLTGAAADDEDGAKPAARGKAAKAKGKTKTAAAKPAGKAKAKAQKPEDE